MNHGSEGGALAEAEALERIKKLRLKNQLLEDQSSTRGEK